MFTAAAAAAAAASLVLHNMHPACLVCISTIHTQCVPMPTHPPFALLLVVFTTSIMIIVLAVIIVIPSVHCERPLCKLFLRLQCTKLLSKP